MGDFPGHPFRGNQYSDGGSAEAGARTYVETELRAATGYRDSFTRGANALRTLKVEAEDAKAMGKPEVAKGIERVLNDPRYEAAYREMVATQRGPVIDRRESSLKVADSRTSGVSVSRGDYRANEGHGGSTTPRAGDRVKVAGSVIGKGKTGRVAESRGSFHVVEHSTGRMASYHSSDLKVIGGRK